MKKPGIYHLWEYMGDRMAGRGQRRPYHKNPILHLARYGEWDYKQNKQSFSVLHRKEEAEMYRDEVGA